MTLVTLQRFFDTSPAMRLLRSPNAAWIVDFLQQQFKRSGQITHPHSTLLAELDRFLETLGRKPTGELSVAGDPLMALRGKAESYLSTWCSGDCGWLKRFVDQNHAEPVYQLTADSELVLAFVHKATQPATAIGTQSHLRSILNLLEDAAGGCREGSQQAAAAEPILGETSQAERQVDVPLVREQFSLAVTQLEQLKSQFRAVEERFKSITRGVQQRLLAAEQPRGEILQFALDAEDLLKSGEHGRSFFQFLRLVHDPASQERIAELVQQLVQFDVLADRHDELQSLRTMIPTLLAEAEKILRTTQHLSHTLRRLLDARSTRHHQQLAQVLRDIRAQATGLSQSPPLDISLEVEVEIDVQVPFDRPFWSQAEPFVEVELQLVDSDPDDHARALEQLVALERIDWQSMRRNIARSVQRQGDTTIAELLEQFPIQTGTVELLGYLQIAHEDGHRIDAEQTVELWTAWEGTRARQLRLPQVIFRSHTGAQPARHILDSDDKYVATFEPNEVDSDRPPARSQALFGERP